MTVNLTMRAFQVVVNLRQSKAGLMSHSDERLSIYEYALSDIT